MIRISASDLESYRYWLNSEDQDMATLLRKLRRKEPPHPRMEAGKAFAKLMEHATPGELTGATIENEGDTDGGGWRFVFAVDDEFNLSTCRELKAEEEIATPSGPVTLVAKCDGVTGIVVRDQKLTEKPDPEKYLDSLQWRTYLMLFGAQKFVYDLFGARFAPTMENLERMWRENDRPPGFTPCVTVTSYDAVPFYAYPGMDRDVLRAVSELAEVITRHAPDLIRQEAA